VAIRVECPNCKQTLESPDEFAGRVAICPACRTKVQIPSLPPTATSPQATPLLPPPTSGDPLAPQQTAKPPDTKARPTKSVDRIESMVSDVRAELRTLNRRLGCLIGLIVVVAALGLAAGYFLLHQASWLNQPVTLPKLDLGQSPEDNTAATNRFV
jgi:hypothetical protein